jgi:hypothetical protein
LKRFIGIAIVRVPIYTPKEMAYLYSLSCHHGGHFLGHRLLITLKDDGLVT